MSRLFANAQSARSWCGSPVRITQFSSDFAVGEGFNIEGLEGLHNDENLLVVALRRRGKEKKTMFFDRVLGDPTVDDLAVEELHPGRGRGSARLNIHRGDPDFEIAPPWILDEEDRLQALELDSEILTIGGHDLDETIAWAEHTTELSPAGGTIPIVKDDISSGFIPHAHPSKRPQAHGVHAITQKNEELILNSSFLVFGF